MCWTLFSLSPLIDLRRAWSTNIFMSNFAGALTRKRTDLHSVCVCYALHSTSRLGNSENLSLEASFRVDVV